MAAAIIAYAASALAMVVVDGLWLSLMAPRFYKPVMGDIALSGFNIAPAVAFYALYPIGVVIFAVFPGWREQSVATALIYGALFGFFTYATYDLTNYATLRNWTLSLTVIDIAWGTVLAALSAGVAFTAVTRLTG